MQKRHTCNLRGDLRRLLFALRAHAGLCDKCLQNAGVGVLRIAEVEQLVEQLVDENEIGLYLLLREPTEIGLRTNAIGFFALLC